MISTMKIVRSTMSQWRIASSQPASPSVSVAVYARSTKMMTA